MTGRERALELFAQALRSHGRAPIWTNASKRLDLCWRGVDGVHVVLARSYGMASDGAIRFCVDHYRTPLSERAWRELGMPHTRWSLRRVIEPRGRCEQTCHESELHHVAAWLAEWTILREVDRTAPAPPVPVVWTRDIAEWRYGWSAFADAIVRQRREAREVARAAVRSARRAFA